MRATTALLLCTSLTLAGGLTQPALAQEAAAAGTLSAENGNDARTTQPEGDIVVTGSRLAVTGYTATTPTTVLDEKAIEQRAPAQISDITNRLPSVRLTAGPSQGQRWFLSGAAPIDLRGFGAGRTLTLVDGYRFTSGSVDTNLIPVNLIERVDVVTGGASAAYGSDAVAGVVNFVLRKRMEGLTATAQAGISQHGDAFERVVNLAFGTSFADGRGHLIAGVDYAKNDGVGPLSSRAWGRENSYLVSNGLSRPAGVPAESFETGVTYSQQTIGGLIVSGPLAGTAFGSGGSLYQFDYGTVYSTLMVGGTNERGNPNANPPLLTPISRRAGLVRAEYEFIPSVTAFIEGNYGYTETDSTSGFYQSRAIIEIDNPFMPGELRQRMIDAGVNSITVGRLTADYGGFNNSLKSETLRGLGGFEGDLGGSFSWDAAFQYSQTKNDALVEDVVIANYLAAVDVIKGPDGEPVCADPSTNPNLAGTARLAQVQPGCQPFDLFGPYAASAEAVDYITGHGGAASSNISKLWNAAFNVRGSPFSTWAGPLQIAAGAEWRKESYSNHQNALAIQSAWLVSNGGEFSGTVTVKELYGEVGIPLARDLPFARSLDLNAAFRLTDYSTSGGVQTWKIGGTWEPVDGLMFRGTRSRDIRAPTLGNLYASGKPGGCCNVTNPFNGQTGHLDTSFEGNPNLRPEIADTTTFGAVISPHALPWLRASADYYEIKLKDSITTVFATEIINRCYNGQDEYCEAVVFDNSTFGIDYVKQSPFNLNKESRRGIDFSLDLNFDLADDTSLAIVSRASKLIDSVTNDRGTIVDRAGSIQGGGVPAWTGTTDISLTKGPWKATLSGNFFSEAKFDATKLGPEDEGYDPSLSNSLNTNRVPGGAYFDLYGQYTFDAGKAQVTVFGMVQNLLDKDPWVHAMTNIVSGGNTFDLIGRRFRLGVKVSL